MTGWIAKNASPNLWSQICPSLTLKMTGSLWVWAAVDVIQNDTDWALDSKASAYNAGDPGSDPWVGKIPWRRKWQSTPGLLPGKSHGQRSLVGYSPWGLKESDTTEPLYFHCLFFRMQGWSANVSFLLSIAVFHFALSYLLTGVVLNLTHILLHTRSCLID